MTPTCQSCGEAMPGRSARAVFCSDRCRKRAARNPAKSADKSADTPRLSADSADADPTATMPALVADVWRALEAAGRRETWLGAAALHLAAAMSWPGQTASSVGAATKQLEATMSSALAGTEAKERDYLDEIGRRRDAKRAG